MNIAIVGAGMLGLTLAHRLGAGTDHRVTVIEQSPSLGGLAASHDYGRFTWDRFYHCILPTDASLIGFIEALGLGSYLRWKQTGTGYYAEGRCHDMSSNLDFARFPLLSLADKARLAATVLYASRFADPWALYTVSAEDWLTAWCGRRGYQRFWRPLLRAKFGPYHDQVAAVFIWATLTRLFGARAAGSSKEKLGYVSGGYHRILGAIERDLQARGVSLHTGSAVEAIARDGDGCRIRHGGRDERFDQVIFTAPTRIAGQLVEGDLADEVARSERAHPTSAHYLGVACLVLALQKPLTPYYVLNIGDENVAMTGLIEFSNLLDPRVETDGLSLIYIPQYMDAADPRFEQSDEALLEQLMDRGLRRLFPIDDADIVYRGIHRARFVQPLPLVRSAPSLSQREPSLAMQRPFCILNTSLLTCATLNNNEVVRLVDNFMQANRRWLADPQPPPA